MSEKVEESAAISVLRSHLQMEEARFELDRGEYERAAREWEKMRPLREAAIEQIRDGIRALGGEP